MPARIPGMAAADAAQALCGSDNESVLLDGLNEVLTACRCEATVGTQQWTDHFLIDPNRKNGRQSGQAIDPQEQLHLRLLPIGRCAPLASRFAIFLVSRRSELW